VRKLTLPIWLAVVAILGAAVPAAAAIGVPTAGFVVPYQSYTYDYWGQPAPAPQAYLPVSIIRGRDLGVGDLRNPNDLHVSASGHIYIADTGNNRVIVLDPEWRLVRIISEFENAGGTDRLNGPRGLYVTEDESLYIADTGNGRILHFDAEGRLVRVIGRPESDIPGIIPANFDYRPLKVGVDRHGRIYVVAQDLYEGLITFSQDGRFRGFMGAPRVTPNFLDYLWSRIATREQRAQLQAFLPTEYSNFDLDPEGFIYATVVERDESTASTRYDRVKLLNPKGEDLLRRIGFHPPIGDVQFPDRWSTASQRGSSLLADVVVHDLGVYSVLDSNRGRVFTYDSNGNLLYVFGYRGTDHGQTAQPVALAAKGLDMMILDAQQAAIVLFEPTEYTLLIWAAMHAYHRGQYEETEALWRKVLELNANYDLAYTGIGRSLLRRGEYAEAMHYFRLGNNRRDYSEAFSLYRRGVIYENFGVAAMIGIVVIGGGVALRPWFRRRFASARAEIAAFIEAPDHSGPKKLLADTLAGLRLARYAIFHPYEGFHRLKLMGTSALPSAFIILFAVVGTYVAARQYTGFIFNTADLTRVNLYLEVASVLVPFTLWCVVNWALTTLMDGKGKFWEIVAGTAFALLPMFLIQAPLIVVSNYITAEEGSFYYFFQAIGTLWTGVLILLGAVMTIHDYDFTKAFWTCVLTVAGIGFVLFLAFLGINLSEQVVMFVNEIITELLYRT